MRHFFGCYLLLSVCVLAACSTATVTETGERMGQNASGSIHQEAARNIISSKDLTTTIMTNDNQSNEVMVVASFPSKEMELERKLTVIRIVNQVIRDSPSVTFLTLWDDERSAKEWAEDGHRV